MDISSLYIFPVLTAATVPPIPAYVAGNPLKYWARPLEPGEGETDSYVYQYYTSNAVLATETTTKGAAAVANVPPAVLPLNSPASNSAVAPPPVNTALLPPGASVVENPMTIFGGLPLITLASVTSSTGTVSTEDPNVLAILADVTSIGTSVASMQTQLEAIGAAVVQLLSK